LGEHASGDEVFAADVVGIPAGDQLPGPPYGGVQRGENADLGDAQPVGGEQEREDAPSEGIVEVVDHAGLAGGGQGGFGEAGAPGDLARAQVEARAVAGGLGAGVLAGFSYSQAGQSEAEGGVGDAEQERLGAQPGVCGDGSGGPGGHRHGHRSRRLR
jgi:hypothetical protein